MSYVIKYRDMFYFNGGDPSGVWSNYQHNAKRFATIEEARAVRRREFPLHGARIVRLKPPAGMVPETVVDEVVDGADRLVKALILLFRGGTHWFVSEADLARGDEYDLRYSSQSEDGSIIVSVVKR